MSKYESPFFPEEYYHVFNRAVGDDLLFKNASHNLFFLQRVEKYFLRVADIFCYNLLPNHFHFLLRIKNEMALGKASKELHPGKTLCISHMPDFTLQQFGN
ncbi:MAG: hypothetical protein ACXWCG_12810, partial [Flavitalea sp.]